MGVRIVQVEGEPIGTALRRFKKLLERHGVTWEQRFKSRMVILLAQREGEQPVISVSEATETFWKRTG